jgi:hypothetical protein
MRFSHTHEFSHAHHHEVLLCEREGIARRVPGAADSRRRLGEEGIDKEERDHRMRRELMNKQREEQAEADGEDEVDEK